MASARLRLSVDEARALGERALHGIGYDVEESRIIADHVIDAALCGYEYSGLAKIRIPSEQSFRNRARFGREGLEIDRAVYDALETWAAKA